MGHTENVKPLLPSLSRLRSFRDANVWAVRCDTGKERTPFRAFLYGWKGFSVHRSWASFEAHTRRMNGQKCRPLTGNSGYLPCCLFASERNPPLPRQQSQRQISPAGVVLH